MDDRTDTSDREDIHTFITATNNPFYRQNLPILKDLFSKSMQAKYGRYSFFDIQAELLGHIIAADSAHKKYLRRRDRFASALGELVKCKAPLQRIKHAQSALEAMQESATAARLFVGQLRSIGDAIAWRFLNYDRAVLRLLAEHAYVSVPEVGTGLYAEIDEVAHLAEKGYKALLNSVTNVLRVGDITLYDQTNDTYKLVEVKAGKLQTPRTIRQGQHLAIVQEGLEAGSHSVFSGITVTKMMARTRLLTYIRSVDMAIAKAEQKLVSSRLFDEYLSLGVFAAREIASLPEREADRIRDIIMERCMRVVRRENDVPLPLMSNIFPTLHFSRMLAPYAIFPIDHDRRFALMTGEFLVFSLLNVSGLARWLEKRGWKTKTILPPNKLSGNHKSRYVPVLQVWKRNSHKKIELGLDTLLLAAMEFWMPESIERMIITVFNEGVPESAYSVNFPNVGKYGWD